MLISYGFIFQLAKVHNIINNVEAITYNFQIPIIFHVFLGGFKKRIYLRSDFS